MCHKIGWVLYGGVRRVGLTLRYPVATAVGRRPQQQTTKARSTQRKGRGQGVTGADRRRRGARQAAERQSPRAGRGYDCNDGGRGPGDVGITSAEALRYAAEHCAFPHGAVKVIVGGNRITYDEAAWKELEGKFREWH